MPSKTNFYSLIKGKTRDEINNVFQKHNWTIHKSAWSEYEYQNGWAELVLENDGEDLLLHGLVVYNINNVKFIQELFDFLLSICHPVAKGHRCKIAESQNIC